MVIAWPDLPCSDPLVAIFLPPLSSFQCTFSLAGFGTGGSKDSGCVPDFFDRYLLYCSNLLGTPQSLMAWHGEGKACLRSSCLLLCCHLPLCALFGLKLDAFSTKATIRDIGQFGTHCHRLPFTKLNLVQNLNMIFIKTSQMRQKINIF